MIIQENIPIAPLTTFKVGGPARYFCEAETEDEVLDAVLWAQERGLPLFVLGGGSNLVVSDAGWPGLVLRIAIRGVLERDEGRCRVFTVGAGEDWDAFVAHAVAQNCAGIECLSGIPGTVGGTPIQNVGAYGQEVAETITSVRVLDLNTFEVLTMSSADCGFAYRTSIFNSTERGRYIVLQVTFALTPRGAPKIAYADLRKHFGAESAPALQDVRDTVRAIRRSKGMLIVEGDEDCRSAGSFFKNPVIPREHFERISAEAEQEGRLVPSYPAPNGSVKVPAAWLVEQAGFAKGYTLGPAGISKKHTLAIINRGGARAEDILALRDQVRCGVYDKFGIELQPEPVLVGF